MPSKSFWARIFDPQGGTGLQVPHFFNTYTNKGKAVSLKNNLNNLDLTNNSTVTFTYEDGTDVFHFNETHVDTALSETDVVERLASVTTSGLNISTQYGESPIEVLRGRELLEGYERGSFAFEEFVAEAIRDNFYDVELIEESTEHYDHKRGFTTLTTTVVAPVEDVISDSLSYETTFSGWTAEVDANGGKFSFEV
tara:strand:+ start:394 stop:981 length:588 start_codon:yes stop_codon:yes gene_type:complete